MKSPITGKEMSLRKEKRSIDFRKETFEVVFHFYYCEESGEQFTTTAMDEVNMNQVYNQYRDLNKIPFPDEITRIREKYNLSAAKIAEILGFGINSYRQYEVGEMPSVSNARLIQMIDDPKKFIEMVTMCVSLDEKTKAKYSKIANQLIAEEQLDSSNFKLKDYLLGNHRADIFSGYRNPSFEKFTEMIVYFSVQMAPFKTKINKLLFYADFLMFKESCFSISGVRYHAINMGPVPNNFQSIFEYLANKDEFDINYINFPQGGVGEQFKARKGRTFNAELFSTEEIAVLNKVSLAFKTTSTSDIIEFSHLEDAWKENERGKNVISYEYAFELNQL